MALAMIFCGFVAAADSSWYPRITDQLDIDHTYLYSSLYTRHYDPDPDHVNDQNLIGLEIQTSDKRVYGLSLFDNSFGQESEYFYAGYKYRAFDADRWYFKLTGGLIHGYREPYDDKIPLNDLGVAPAIIPTLGVQHKYLAAEFSQLGLAAAMITAGIKF